MTRNEIRMVTKYDAEIPGILLGEVVIEKDGKTSKFKVYFEHYLDDFRIVMLREYNDLSYVKDLVFVDIPYDRKFLSWDSCMDIYNALDEVEKKYHVYYSQLKRMGYNFSVIEHDL